MLTLLLSLLACHTEPDPSAHSTAPPDAPAAQAARPAITHVDHHAADQGLLLTLNGSEKWRMDDHTRAAMGEIRATLAAPDPTNTVEGRAIGATLQAQLDGLISGCTMEGAAHDELHVFLMAFLPGVSGLKTTPDDAAAAAQLATLRHQVHTYDQFFE